LVIGLNDQYKLLGLEPDYSSLRTRPNRDRFERALAQTWQTPSGMVLRQVHQSEVLLDTGERRMHHLGQPGNGADLSKGKGQRRR
jgi:hypothetical protein